MPRSALALVFFGFLALSGCHRRGPVPAYPWPEDPPLEETDLAPFLETPEGSGSADATDEDTEGADSATPPDSAEPTD